MAWILHSSSYVLVYGPLNVILKFFDLASKNFNGVLVYEHVLVLRGDGAVLWAERIVERIACNTCSILNDDVEKVAYLVYIRSYILLCGRIRRLVLVVFLRIYILSTILNLFGSYILIFDCLLVGYILPLRLCLLVHHL